MDTFNAMLISTVVCLVTLNLWLVAVLRLHFALARAVVAILEIAQRRAASLLGEQVEKFNATSAQLSRRAGAGPELTVLQHRRFMLCVKRQLALLPDGD